MKVSCPSCQTNYNIDDKRIPPGGAKLKCARCQQTFPIKPGEAVSPPAPAPAAVPLPGPSAPAADPYAAYDDFQRPAEAETTRVVSMPLPSAAYRDAAPTVAVPLPGPSAPSTGYAPDLAYNVSASTAPQSEAIPLPGASDPYAGGFDYGADPYASAPQAGAIALPPPASSDPYASADPYAPADPYASSDPYASADPYASSDPYANAPQGSDAIALPPPPSSDEPYPYADVPEAPSADGYDAADPFAAAPRNTSEVDAFGLPPEQDGDPYAAVPVAEEDPFALPPPPAAPEEDPFALPPPPAAPEEDPFALPPPPAAAAYAAAEEDPFALPPPQADVTNLDFSEAPPAAPSTVDVGLDFSEPPPAAPNPSADFGDVDFGAPAGATPSIPDALEFDPSAPNLHGGDDLEADLSAPLPPPPGPGTADGLEMLSFIDDAAKDNGANKAAKGNARRFHVRRRSGKVFGPFEEGVIVKMLEDGQLLGNEDVSTDSESWTPIGTVATFATAIQKLMEGPGTPPAPAAAPAMPAAEPGSKANVSAASAASMERVQQLYGGRMASVSVVDSTSRFEIIVGKIKKRLPLVIGAAAAMAVVGVGLGFGATRYGVFGMKKFFPAQVKPGSPGHADVQAAQKALLQDTFQSYKQAYALSSKVLAGNEYPEVRALWCQSVFYLQRRYSAAESADFVRCRSEEEAGSLELLGEKNVEYIKYLAGRALTAREPDKAIQQLRDALSRDTNQGDTELSFLLAEAYAAKKERDTAISTLTQVLGKSPDSAKAHHALGNLYQASNKADEAAKAYEAALKADATHIISSVELAAVELLLRKDAQKGLEAAERALDEKAQPQMGPAELARARTLKGIALFQLFKLKEAEQELRASLEKDPDSFMIKNYLARVLHAQRQFNEVLPFYEALIKAEPENIEYADGYITTLVTLGKMEDALKAVEQTSKRFPGNARIEYLYGRIDEARDSNTSAEEHYKRAIKADAELVDAYVYLGRLHLRLRRNPQAREQFELAAAKAPENAGVRTGLGELALAEGNVPLAQEEFDRAVGLDPNLADAHLGLSRLALLSGDLEKARKEVDTALELDSHTLKDGRLQRGTVMWRQGQLDEAIAELEQAKKEEPRSVAIPMTLGAVQLAKGNLKEAEANLLLALKGEPSNPETNYYMAQVRAKAGEYTQALENMRIAVERAPAPKRAEYRFVYGTLFRDAKQPLDAIDQWKQAVALDPKMANAHEAIGQAHLERGEFDPAIAAFQTALKTDPKLTRVYASIGDAHFNATRWREATRAYEQALKVDPNLISAYYKLGRAWSELNQYSKAIEWLTKATAATPDNGEAWHDLGYAYKEKGKKKEAVKAFQEYLTRKPEAENRKEIEDEISFLE
ncbi:tetratricopeptide repeat protein [Archangium lipolyticum]|uniref:tetratricopeptide repeat protein n=1 Tax=Archangium lipolyticum TaxID=2970465 RepID=UPI00214A1B52|nr:tetratricopeptide repeat protein [Archangium lipolyticum]